jgi:FeS assembly SUF system protein
MSDRSESQPLRVLPPSRPVEELRAHASAAPTVGEPRANAPAAGAADDPVSALERRITVVLRTIRDPEVPVNIYDLGLVYELRANSEGDVKIRMTLTTPACPVAQSLPGQVESRVRAVPGVRNVVVELVWDPPWSRERIPEAAKLQLGLM